jgi:hypothetical protein
MSASSTASTTLTRNKVAIFALIGLVTVGSVYYAIDTLYADTVYEPVSPGLHRSNAIHRHRQPRRRNARSRPSPDEPSTSETLAELLVEDDEDTSAVARPVDAETLVDDLDYQDDEYSWTDHPSNHQRNGHNIVQLLFRVSEDATRRNSYIHRGCGCNNCGIMPIRGVRYRCSNCADYDLCETCEAQDPHLRTHIFYKVKVPAPSFRYTHMQPVWYSGNPDEPSVHRTLPKELITKLSRETGLERPELDAYWEQWTYMANTEWREDPDGVNLAMDRRTFERSLVPSGGKYSVPSLIFDRMFAFYDTNNDDLIGFSEFLHGLLYRKKKDKWKRVFAAYDLDGDGYVCRKDFLRIFRSYYVLYRRIHQDLVDSEDAEQMSTTMAHKLVTGRQPLSAAFSVDGSRYPAALPNTRTGEGKTPLPNGDLEISDGKGVVKASGSDTGNREDFIRGNSAWRREERYSSGYWDAIVDPPMSMEQIPEVLRNLNRRRGWNATAESIAAEARRSGMPNPFAEPSPPAPSSTTDQTWPPAWIIITNEDVAAVDGAGTSIAHVPLLYQPLVVNQAITRTTTQRELHDRWKRRQFYTDEEEGISAPPEWKDTDDVLAGVNGESSSMANSRPSLHSRSSSRVRFAEDFDDFDTRSNHSNSSRSIPERWGGIEIPDAEKDAGKEILYQVTQQALNELLDPLFRPKENMAVKAAETKSDRDKYRHLFSTLEFAEVARGIEAERRKQEAKGPKSFPPTRNPVWPTFREVEIEPIRERPLEELLEATGYSVDEFAYIDNTADHTNGHANPPRNDIVEDTSPPTEVLPTTAHLTEASQSSNMSSLQPALESTALPVAYDPTMPQFRPNSAQHIYERVNNLDPLSPHSPSNDDEFNYSYNVNEFPPPLSYSNVYPVTLPIFSRNARLPKKYERNPIPSPELDNNFLYELWKAEKEEKEARERGGWGRLLEEVFVKAVKEGIKEGRGGQMEYLGSWIEFCIPY